MNRKKDIQHIAKALEIATRLVMSEIRPDVWHEDLKLLFKILMEKIDELPGENEE